MLITELTANRLKIPDKGLRFRIFQLLFQLLLERSRLESFLEAALEGFIDRLNSVGCIVLLF